MNTRINLALLASGIGTAPSAFAHGGSSADASTLFHYFASPDHVAFSSLVALSVVVLLVGVSRRTLFQRRD